MRTLFFLFSVPLLIWSCSGCGHNEAAPVDETIPDSAQLRIAVMPTLDCLPLYVADKLNLFEEQGLDVSLLRYQAQMDCDTSLLRGRANAVVTDLVRATRMMKEGAELEYVTATDAFWQLLASRNARISKLSQLDNKMVAMTRFSATHLLTDKAVDSARVKTERVFRIQINDVDVRLNMLRTEIMDALWLPEPQATDARNASANVLLDTRQMDYRLGVVAFRKAAATERQTSLFKKAYNQACDSINERGFQAYSHIIRDCCHASPSMLDSLPETQFRHAEMPRESDLKRASEWLQNIQTEKNVEKQ